MNNLLTPPIPRLLNAPMAAAYMGISERTFEKHWRAGTMPMPHRLGRRLVWDRLLLDAFADVLSGLQREEIYSEEDEWKNV